jgi:hypothetical protein
MSPWDGGIWPTRQPPSLAGATTTPAEMTRIPIKTMAMVTTAAPIMGVAMVTTAAPILGVATALTTARTSTTARRLTYRHRAWGRAERPR